MVISTILSDFLDGLEAEKQNVGINRTDSRQRRSRKIFTTSCLLACEGREATTGNASAVRRLAVYVSLSRLIKNFS